MTLYVSILSQPEGRELRYVFALDLVHLPVSILSQPEGRELHAYWCPFRLKYCRFNPLPARRPGATRDERDIHKISRVSILSQPEGRELRGGEHHMIRDYLFQSSPSPKAGSYNSVVGGLSSVNSFNPLPARRPGATGLVSLCPDNTKVSILSQPEGRELPFSPYKDFLLV